ncbi:MAG: hypothetical protein M3Y86_11530 [Verrucomicrobiota bacterium]|nr:hypothetical protein [Verrucomicrobiota bacterium]
MIRAAAFNQGQFPTIGVVNLATVPLGVDLDALIAALQKFLDSYFVPIWGYPAKLVKYAALADIPADQWQFLFIDDADTAGALGYHDLTRNGQPVSKIFVKTTLADKQLVSVTACHELAEMLIDPGAQLWAQKDNKTIVAYEMSDAVEELTFEIDGIAMSNFVFPSYFETWKHPKGTKFDYLGKLTKPFQLAKGGYEIKATISGVGQAFGSAAKSRRFAKENRVGHRSEHRKPNGKVIKKK